MTWIMKLKKAAQHLLLHLVDALTLPSAYQRYKNLQAHVMSLELSKGEYVSLCPVDSVFGQIRLSGAGIPTFHYTVFDQKLMEFVYIEAFVLGPKKYGFTAKTEDLGAVPLKKQYKTPLYTLVRHLSRYFPFYSKTQMDRAVSSVAHAAAPTEGNP